MKKYFYTFLTTVVLALLTLLFLSPAACLAESETAASKTWFKALYDSYHTDGTFVLYDLKQKTWTYYNPERAEKAFLPASTFKIPNSLIALETGVIKDENEIIRWDGEKRFLESWNRDLDLKEAFKVSAVWFYQELARRIGAERMNLWLNKCAYGNKDCRDAIDTFWLDGQLRITAKQQAEFLEKLYKGELPFAPRTMSIVRDIMTVEKTATYVFRAKTGMAIRVEHPVGWYVGWLERDGNVYFFANNIDLREGVDPMARVEIVKKYFRRVKLMEEVKQ